MNGAFAEIDREVYKRRRKKTAWTIDVDAKVQEVFGVQKEMEAKVTQGGHQIRLKISVLHRWWKDFVYAWRRIPALGIIAGNG